MNHPAQLVQHGHGRQVLPIVIWLGRIESLYPVRRSNPDAADLSQDYDEDDE